MRLKQFLVCITASLLTIATSTAQTASTPICKGHTGQPPEAIGNGDCAGNVLRSYDLGIVFDGLKIFYNSSLDHNIYSLGRGITLSDLTSVDIGSSPALWLGDGTVVRLKRQASGTFANMWLAENRTRLSDYFRSDSSAAVTQLAMNGTTYSYARMGGTSRYLLSSVVTSSGKKTEITVGSGAASSTIKFGADTVNFAKTQSGVLQISNAATPDKWVKLTYDVNNRLTQVAYYNGTYYAFRYHQLSNRLAEETLYSVQDGRVVTEVTKFSYDPIGRVIGISLPNGTGISYVRSSSELYVKAIYPNGQVQKTSLDKFGHVTSTTTYVIGREDTPVEEVFYTFNPEGKPLEVAFTSARGTIRRITKYHSQNETVPVGYKEYLNGKLEREFSQTVSLDTMLPELDTQRDRAGTIVAEFRYVYSPSMPYHLKAKIDTRTGTKIEFSGDGDKNSTTHFDRHGTKLSTETTLGGLVTQRVNHLEPISQQTRDYSYDAKGRIVREELGGKPVARYGYDSVGRINSVHDESGVELASEFDDAGYLLKETIKYPGGVATTAYQREFYSREPSGDKLKSLSKRLVLPNAIQEEFSEFDVDGKTTRVTVNGVVVWESGVEIPD